MDPAQGHNAAELVRKLWQYCNVLRDDGLSYPDYVEQLTYLLFLKMADEREAGPVPIGLGWQSFAGMSGTDLQEQYSKVLGALGSKGGMLGLIFNNARNKIQDPAKLHLLVTELIGQTQWSGLSQDVKGDAYEGLLEKNAQDTKSGAGQYFTPRPLIEAIVECVAPTVMDTICDPACGTGGFLLAAFDFIVDHTPEMTPAAKLRLRTTNLRGVELVNEVARLAAMNLVLHGVSGELLENPLPITCGDSLQQPPAEKFDVVLTNPPFGIKGSADYGSRRSSGRSSALSARRSDLWVQTSNKQLMFLQHVFSLLKPGGRAAVVLPDNVLFESGAAATIRRRLLANANVHTLLRLPAGLFYAQGIQANVLFFTRKTDTTEASGKIWVYDLRRGNRFSVRTKPLKRRDLDDFVWCSQSRRRDRDGQSLKSDRWRSFSVNTILEAPDCRLDLAWDDSGALAMSGHRDTLEEISELIMSDLQTALDHMANVAAATETTHLLKH
jgi:type I restriction enzyme M protein